MSRRGRQDPLQSEDTRIARTKEMCHTQSHTIKFSFHPQLPTTSAHAVETSPRCYAKEPCGHLFLISFLTYGVQDFPGMDPNNLEVTLESPRRGRWDMPSFSYKLLKPRGENSYDPVMDLLQTLGVYEKRTCDQLPFYANLHEAVRREHWPTFRDTLEAANASLPSRRLQGTGLFPEVVCRVIEEIEQRVVGPSMPAIKQAPADTSLGYGELRPQAVTDIIKATNLKKDSTFLDLGSGTGLVVSQVALQAGSRCFGIELHETRANTANMVKEQLSKRSESWGFCHGQVTLIEGDMFHSEQVEMWLQMADVVLITNKIFKPKGKRPYNYSLFELLGLYLKQDAQVVSLVPARQTPLEPGKLNFQDVKSVGALFDDASKHPLRDVSWAQSGGEFFVERFDPAGYQDRCKKSRKQPNSDILKKLDARRNCTPNLLSGLRARDPLLLDNIRLDTLPQYEKHVPDPLSHRLFSVKRFMPLPGKRNSSDAADEHNVRPLVLRIVRPGKSTKVSILPVATASKDGHGYTRGYLRAYPYPYPQKPYPCTGRV
ncbi:histone methylation protein DOT1-domain-containing protein [Mycena galericulata]|nr:histone methylation protein DOT1-domain-containing protein [Mycena galericulata]